jgi:2-keto-4-pentenoate hydratase
VQGEAAKLVGHWGEIARALVSARAAGRALPGFPGAVPETLDEAYAVQEALIAATSDPVVGWKVAMIPPDLRERFGAERVCGPVFRKTVFDATKGSEPAFPVIRDGFAAVEAEFVIEIGTDMPAGPFADHAALAPYVGAYRAGVEIAGSPVAKLNPLGSAAVVCDCGGNAGLILGPVLGHEPAPMNAVTTRTLVDGASVGTGDGARIPGGLLAALGFLVAQLASRGRRLRAGDLVSTGATTGIHPVEAGARIEALFDDRIGVRGRAIPHPGS